MTNKQIKDDWSEERARKAEKTLMELLDGIPGVSHLEGCSYSGLQNYVIQFMFGEIEEHAEHCTLGYKPHVDFLHFNGDCNLPVPEIVWHIVSKRVSEQYSKKSHGGISGNGDAMIFGLPPNFIDYKD